MSAPTTKVHVDLADRSYDIHIGRDLLPDGLDYIQPFLRSRDVFVAYDESVENPHYARLMENLCSRDLNVHGMILPSGEETKSSDHLISLWDRLSELRFGRDCTVLALGGGVIGDLVGFAAGSYLRGVDFIQVPTTLLAMVDSSVGGKTGINNRFGKNLLGAFWQPKLVLADMEALTTLDRGETISGIAEIIKYGVIYDAEFFAWLEKNMEALVNLDDAAVIHAVKRSCEIKADVVRQDERESGLREILNFGHTVGHAIENSAGYGTYRHGEAIAIGMVAESLVAIDHFDSWTEDDHDRLVSLIDRSGLPIGISPSHNLDADSLLAIARSDKKARAGVVRYMLPTRIGEVKAVKLDPQAVRPALLQVGAAE